MKLYTLALKLGDRIELFSFPSKTDRDFALKLMQIAAKKYKTPNIEFLTGEMA